MNESATIWPTSMIFTVVYACPAVKIRPRMIAVIANGRPLTGPSVLVRPNAAKPSRSPISGSTGMQNRRAITNPVTAMPLMGFIWFDSVNSTSVFMLAFLSTRFRATSTRCVRGS